MYSKRLKKCFSVCRSRYGFSLIKLYAVPTILLAYIDKPKIARMLKFLACGRTLRANNIPPVYSTLSGRRCLSQNAIRDESQCCRPMHKSESDGCVG